MRTLYLLSDLIDFPTSDSGLEFATVSENFDLVGTAVDLAFQNVEEPFVGEGFYTIPLIYTSHTSTEKIEIARICEEMHTNDTSLTRYLVRTPDTQNPILVKASGEPTTQFESYGSIRFSDTKERIPEFGRRIEKLREKFLSCYSTL